MRSWWITGLVALLFVQCHTAESQNPFHGRFSGEVNGDPVVMTLESSGPGKVRGQMQDAHQTYTIEGRVEGKTIAGTATEGTYGLVLEFRGTLNGDHLPLTMEMQSLGTVSFEVHFRREGSAGVPDNNNTRENNPTTPSGKGKKDNYTRDPAVAGTWVHEEIHNSGYGDQFMGGTISSTITFAADGRMLEGGSSATMSGADYYGSSSGEGNGALEGIRWFTRDQEIWLIASRDGQTQEVKLGRYAFGGGAMRITADNGEKLLLKRQ